MLVALPGSRSHKPGQRRGAEASGLGFLTVLWSRPSRCVKSLLALINTQAPLTAAAKRLGILQEQRDVGLAWHWEPLATPPGA